MLREGDRLPAFELRSTAREAVTHSDFLGRTGVLVFFPRAFTAGCRTELRAFQGALADFEALGAHVAGVSVDTWLEQRRFAAAEGIEFPLLSDWPHRGTLDAFGVRAPGGHAHRVTVVFDADLVVRGVVTDVEPSAHVPRALALARDLVMGSGTAGD